MPLRGVGGDRHAHNYIMQRVCQRTFWSDKVDIIDVFKNGWFIFYT